MKVKEDKKIINPIVTEHWKLKFEKSILILLKSGRHPDELMEEIRKCATELQNEKNN